jgi:hypothetical protein
MAKVQSEATPIHLHSMGRTTLHFTFITPKEMFLKQHAAEFPKEYCI